MNEAREGRPGSSGTVTFLFTDLEGSTRLWERHPDTMRAALERHDELLRTAIEGADGRVVKTMGDGLMAVFPDARDAVRAALDAQRLVLEEDWDEVGELRVRMGLHAGVAHAREGDYHGRVVNRAARIMGVAHGGQVLLSDAVAALLDERLPGDATLRDLGEHRLRDLERAEHLFELVHPGLPADLPPLRSLTERPNNLPTQTSSFVGRRQELAAIRERITDPGTRLLTLLGPGGTGKTRLALQAAAEQVDRFDDGIFFVDLAEARDTPSIVALIARAVGLDETPDGTGTDDLAGQLEDRSMLLVLDNFEQVTRAGAAVVDLLEACPDLKVMVTSRESLHVRGERILPIPPLGLSDAPGDDAGRSEAVQLFVDRARSVRPDLEVTRGVDRTIARIVALLDGLPLAIELAAARLNLFTPQGLLERLRAGTGVLGAGPRDLPERQQTLEDTIAWSYDLLEPHDRVVFQISSVFSSITVATAEGVVTELGSTLTDPIDVVDGLASLVDKSLLRREPDVGAVPRFTMLRTIREYATERLEETPGLAEPVHRAHGTYFASLAQQGRASLSERKRSEVVAELAAEADDLQTAWRYWVDVGDLGELDRLVDPLWLLYDTLGWHQATVELTTDLLQVIAGSPSTPDLVAQQVTLLISLARVLMGSRGYTEEVAATYQRALAIAERNEGMDLFPLLRGLSSIYNFTAQYDRAAEVSDRLLAVAESSGDRSMLLEAHLMVGTTTAFRNAVDVGLEHLDRAIQLMDPEEDMARRFRFGPYPGVPALTTSAFLLWERGFPDRARRHADRALAIAEELDHPLTRAYAAYHVGFMHLLWGEPDVTASQADAVCDAADRYDLALWGALGDCLAGAAQAWIGSPEEGLARFEAGLERYEGMLTPPVFWPFLLLMHAGALGRVERPDDGLAVLGEAIELATAMGGDGGSSGMVAVPRFLLLQGDLQVADDGRDERAAAEPYEHALAIGVEMDLRMPRLLAATALHRLRLGGPEQDRSLQVLRNAYDRFDEGFTTGPLVAAERLLAEAG